MRLIDADALKIMRFTKPLNADPEVKAFQTGWNDALESAAENAPTVEAVPIETHRRLLDAMRQPRRVICPDCGHIFTMVQDARMDEVEE